MGLFRTITYLSLAGFFLSSHADAQSIKRVVIQMDKDLKRGHCTGALDLFEDNEERLSNNRRALEIVGLCEESTQNYEKAAEIFEALLIRYDRSFHKQVISRARLRGRINSVRRRLPKRRMLFYYQKLAQIHSKSFLETSSLDSWGRRRRRYKKAMLYLRVSGHFDPDDSFVEDWREKVVNHWNEFKKRRLKGKIDFLWNYITFQDFISLKNGSSGQTTKILNTTTGSCLGAGYRKSNYLIEYSFDTCYFSGKSTVSSLDNRVSYEQGNVAVSGFYGGLGVMWKGMAEQMGLGLQTTFLTRSGDWQTPSSSTTTYEMEDTSYVRFGYNFVFKWWATSWFFMGRFGKIFKNESSITTVGFGYTF